MRTALAPLLLALGTALALPAAAQWMWHDDAGKPVFSDQPPPPHVPEQRIQRRPTGSPRPAVPPAAAEPAEASAPTVANGEDKQLQQRRQQAEAEEAARHKAEQQAQARARTENCARARQAKANLDSGMRMARVNAQGEREFLDEASRAAEARRIGDVMARDCAPSPQ